MATKIVNAKEIQDKAKNMNTVVYSNGVDFQVKSGTSNKIYSVHRSVGGWEDDTYTCSCNWGAWHDDSGCSHVGTVREHLKNLEGRTISIWTGGDDGRQHRSSEKGGDGTTITNRKIGSTVTAVMKQQVAKAIISQQTESSKTGKVMINVLVKTVGTGVMVTGTCKGKTYQTVGKNQQEAVMSFISQISEDGIVAILKVVK